MEDRRGKKIRNLVNESIPTDKTNVDRPRKTVTPILIKVEEVRNGIQPVAAAVAGYRSS